MAVQARKIAVVMHTHMVCYRDILRGIGAFASARATWKVLFFTPKDNIVKLIQIQKPDGLLLGTVPSPEVAVTCLKQVPAAVTIATSYSDMGVSVAAEIDVANERVGAMAAEHFLQKGYTQFAYIGFAGEEEPGGRLRGFADRLAQAGHTPAVLFPNWEPITTGRGWKRDYPNTEITPFIQGLSKPLAILAHNDIRGREIVDACKEAGLRVPEEVAIMGVDNDQMECELAHPALSSVRVPWEQIGYMAAELLDRAMEAQPVAPMTFVAPVGIAERHSTDIIAISDSEVASALRYIRDHAHVPFSVEEVTAATATGRRTLEKRFKAILGRTVHDEIRRVRLERAKQLLAQTELAIAEISRGCGYPKVGWFSTDFSKYVGISPIAHRKRFRR